MPGTPLLFSYVIVPWRCISDSAAHHREDRRGDEEERDDSAVLLRADGCARVWGQVSGDVAVQPVRLLQQESQVRPLRLQTALHLHLRGRPPHVRVWNQDLHCHW